MKLIRMLSLVLSLCIVFSIATLPVMAESGVTIEALQEQYPHGVYWNGGNADSYTLTPCTHHPDCDYTGGCDCNSFRGLGIQCLGFAYQLATIVYGGNQYLERSPIYVSSAIDNIKAGDIVRYKNGTHSIFVTSVDGDIVTYADCNSDNQCGIRWGQTILKSTLKASFTYLDPAPYAWVSGEGCDCSRSYEGNYKCVVDGSTLNIRSGHGTSHSKIGSIPDGAIVYVSKSNGEWAHVFYNGINGYVSMEYLELEHSHSYELLYEEEHPHKEYYKCSCGDWYYSGDDGQLDNCKLCKLAICEENGHTYDNDCDMECNVCETVREIEHAYDNDCDMECNKCGETRKVGDHIYDNDCDAECNECSELRETSHTYDNDCDTDCNVCGDTREVGDHVYDNACDVDCNICSVTRTVGDHLYDDDKDANCNECGFEREVITYISGDVNGDGEVNNKDLGILRRFLNDWDVEINELASDVDRNGEVNNKDLGILRRYLNDWDVELK